MGWQRGLFLSGDFRVHNEAASLGGTSHPAGFSEADLTMTVHNGQSAPAASTQRIKDKCTSFD